MSDFSDALRACSEELLKMAVSRAMVRVPQSRSGRRPMRVDTMLRKEKDGTLYKSGASPVNGKVLYEDPTDQFSGKARLRRRRYDVPSRDEPTDGPDRMDGRGEVHTQMAPGSNVAQSPIPG